MRTKDEKDVFHLGRVPRKNLPLLILNRHLGKWGSMANE